MGETPSCGSGAISAVLELCEKKKMGAKILVEFTSGEQLKVELRENITWLEGPVRQVFCGKLP